MIIYIKITHEILLIVEVAMTTGNGNGSGSTAPTAPQFRLIVYIVELLLGYIVLMKKKKEKNGYVNEFPAWYILQLL